MKFWKILITKFVSAVVRNVKGNIIVSNVIHRLVTLIKTFKSILMANAKNAKCFELLLVIQKFILKQTY